MSESTIPFQGQTAVLDAPLPEPVEEDGGNRTKLLLLGGLAAALVLGLVAYFVVFAGDDAADDGVVPKPAGAAPAPAVEEAEQPAKKQRLSAKSFGRDPFKPLIVEPVAAVNTAPSATSGDTASGGTSGSESTGGSTGTTTQPETSTPQASTAHSFRVVEVAPDNSTVTVKVDGDTYRNLRAGEVFADYFKVVLISGQVNSFQYGEEKFNVLGTKRLTIA
jgi:hypothetical protein